MPCFWAERYRRSQSISKESFPCTTYIEHSNYTHKDKSVWCNNVVNTNEKSFIIPLIMWKEQLTQLRALLIYLTQQFMNKWMWLTQGRELKFTLENYNLNLPISQKTTQILMPSCASLSQKFIYTLPLSVTSILWSVKQWKIKEHTVYDNERQNLDADYVRNDIKLNSQCTIYHIWHRKG